MGDSRTYRDAFPEKKKGIFYYMQDVPWKIESDPLDNTREMREELSMAHETLDTLLYIEYGERVQSAILREYDDGSGITSLQGSEIAQLVLARNKVKWTHLWNAMTAEYNPVDNYNAIESEHIMTDAIEAESASETENAESALTQETLSSVENNLTDAVSSTRNQGETHSGQDSASGNSAEKLHVLGNSSGNDRQSANGNTCTSYGHIVEYSGSDNEETTRTGTVTESRSGTNGSTQERVSETETERNRSDQTVRQLQRKGNIGVTTAAQMIKGEIDLWENYDFYYEVVKDVADALTLNIWV